MRPLRSLAIYIAAILIGGALLAPWLYWLAQWAAEHSSGMGRLAKQPFPRFLNRSMLALAVLGLWPFLRSIGVNSWQALGFAKPAGQWKHLAYGLAVGFSSLACVALVVVATGSRRLDLDFSSVALLVALRNAALAALLVPLLEEPLFRGALFGALRKEHHWAVALLTSSVIYALVHFFPRTPSPPEITWSSGLELLLRMLSGFTAVEKLVPAVFTLTVAGLILGLAYHQTGTLYLSIGLHAGWIFWLKFYGFLTASQPGANAGFWGSARLIDGWPALIVLILVFVLLWFTQRKKMAASYAS